MIIESTTDLIEPILHPRYTTYRVGERTIGLVLNEDVTLENTGEMLRRRLIKRDGEKWQIADILNQSTLKFGEAAAQLIPHDDELLFSTTYGWLAKIASVGSRYTLEERLYPLSFSHYAECAYCPKPLRDNLLRWAVETKASTKELRAKRNEYLPDDNNGLNFIQSGAGVIEAYSLSSDDVRGLLDGSKPKFFSIDGVSYRVRLEKVESE